MTLKHLAAAAAAATAAAAAADGSHHLSLRLSDYHTCFPCHVESVYLAKLAEQAERNDETVEVRVPGHPWLLAALSPASPVPSTGP